MKPILNELFDKNEIWFLQTHLNSSESKLFKYYLKNKNNAKVTVKFFLTKMIKKKERLDQLFLIYENYLNSIHIEKNKLISKNELEQLMKKRISEHAPFVLNYMGQKEILKKPLVAIIGSRHPTLYGREQCFRFAKALSAKGFTIISGGAIGIDSIANSVALEQNGGSCVILGSGLSQLYPPSNLFLFKNLQQANNGLILTEFFEKEPPQKWNFPKRNHTIALLADFVLVIEGTLTSGSLITANAAIDYGTDVGAIPGYVDCINSEGTNSLIQKGAYCIQKPQDVIERVEYIYQQRVHSCHAQ